MELKKNSSLRIAADRMYFFHCYFCSESNDIDLLAPLDVESEDDNYIENEMFLK
jgi:hypothetical protein